MPSAATESPYNLAIIALYDETNQRIWTYAEPDFLTEDEHNLWLKKFEKNLLTSSDGPSVSGHGHREQGLYEFKVVTEEDGKEV